MSTILSASEESPEEKAQTRMVSQPKSTEGHKPAWLTFFDEEEAEFIEKI
jgi:hypothetical protein